MRKYIITSLALIFVLLGIGSGVTIYHLLNTTSNLRHLINLHEIVDIRQALSFSLQKIQGYTFSSQEYFAKHLDEIIVNAEMVDQTVARCHECHHETAVEAELHDVEALISEYQEHLSYLITTVSEGERRHNLQLKVIDLSNVILNHVLGMVSRSSSSLHRKTAVAMHKIDASYKMLAITLLLTFLGALGVAQYLAGRMIKPIDDLRTAAHKIAEGELGYQTRYKGSEEFKELINTFNNMSGALLQKEETIRSSMQKLNQLSLLTLPFHAAQNMSTILNNLSSTIPALIDVEHIGILLPAEENDHFILHVFDTGTDKTARDPITLAKDEIRHIYQKTGGAPLLVNDGQGGVRPFAENVEGIKAEKILAVWMHSKDNGQSALIAINKKDGDFNEEDAGILGILANNISVALENIRLLKNAQQHMLELKKTQRQLIEAEKLTALGTLAGGVAHDFNNILCGMIGYVALLKRNLEPEDKDYKMLDTIEKAGFRAANLTKQLLSFSRQEALDLLAIEVNPHIENVAKLLENTISKLISIKLELGETLPPVLSDPAQLEQIIINLSLNARDAMPKGGQILIRSEHASIDQKFCEENPEAKTGEYIKITVSDQGQGIDREILPRIFEPFFTTKEFGKGTGLGLAMVYGIVKSHKGFIILSSTPGKGTSFTVYLPEAGPARKEERQPPVSDQLLRANILIVDDEELVASMLAKHLQNLGCRTYHASNGEEALKIINQHKDMLDVVILDINMPVMDGKTAYEKMIELKPDLKVLVASGYSLNGTAREILEQGAQGFIQKPYSLDNIALKIRQVLQG